MRLRRLFYTQLLLWPLWAAGCGGADTVGAGATARAPDLRRGTLETGKGPVPITYEVINGRAIFEGDIDLGPADGKHVESAGIADSSRRFNTGDLWKNGVAWYRIDHDNVAPWLEETIRRAIAHINSRTSAYLIEDIDESHHDHILYTAVGSGCHSRIGRDGGEQEIVLSNGCDFFDTAVHETGHALGLIHEQSRLDRDSYVNIIWSNIQKDRWDQFDKRDDTVTFSEYDTSSVMHYDSFNSFAVDTSKPTITRKDGSTFSSQTGKGLSDGDVRGIQIMYGAPYEPVAAAVSWAPGRLDVFARGTDGALYHQAGDGRSFWGWESLGGFIIGAPEVVSWGPNRLDIFVRGGDRGVYHKAWTGSAWYPSQTGWERLGGPIDGALSVVSWGPNRLDIFGRRDSDGQMMHKAWTGTAWYPSMTDWEPLDGLFAGPVKAVSWGPGRIDLFAADINMEPFHKAWDGSTWSRWESLGGRVMGPISATSWAPGRLDVIAKGTDQVIYHKAWQGAWYPSQTSWEAHGQQAVGTPQIVSPGNNRLDLFAQSTDGKLAHRAWTGSTWTAWESLGGQMIGSPVAVSWGSLRLDVFVRGGDDAVYHKSWDGFRWMPSADGDLWDPLGGRITW